MLDHSTLTHGIFLNGFANSNSLKVLHSPQIKNPISHFPENGSNLTIVVLSFNRVTCTIRLINSLERFITDYKGKLLIIDNGSSPDQLRMLEDRIKNVCAFSINLIKLEKNYGVAGARNKAIEFVETEWFMSLDNDIYLINNPLPSIKNCIEKLNVMFLNVPLLQPDGNTVDAFGGNLWTEPYEDSFFISGTSTFRQLPVKSIPKVDVFVSTFLFGGASVINKQAFIENGCYEDNMFIGFEDTELSLRLAKKGIKIGNATSFCFIHAHEAPKNNADVDAEKARFSAEKIKESGAYFRQKHGLIVWKPSVDTWIEERFKELKIDEGSKNIIQDNSNEDDFLQVVHIAAPGLEILSVEAREQVDINVNHMPLNNDTTNLQCEVIALKEKLKHAEYTIRMMETSKFWAARNFWFKQRKKLGIADDGMSFSIKSLISKRREISTINTIAPYQYDSFLKKVPNKITNGKTLIFIPYMVVGGAETAILQVLNGFTKNKIQTSLIVSNHPLSDNMGDTSADFLNVCPDTYVLEDYNNLWNDQDNWKHWKNITYAVIKKRQIDTIIISNSSFAYVLLPELKEDFPHIKVINPVYSVVGHMVDNIKYESFIDLTVVENPLVEAYLIRDCLRSPQKIRRIENGVDIKKFKPVSKKIADIKVNGIKIPDSKLIVSFLGRLSEEKAPDLFLEIANQLREEKNIHFILSGDGPMQEAVLTMMTKMELENVTYTGFADSVSVLSITDIMLLPSRIDGRPNVVLESLAMGVPVIASNVGGLPWIISKENSNGIICEACNIMEFKEAILKLSKDIPMLNHFKQSSRAYAVEQLDVAYMQNGYSNICTRKGKRHQF